MQLLTEVARDIWAVLTASAPWFLIGCLAAGLLHALLPMSAVARHLGGRGFGTIIKATLIGIPLPLCSCSVIPMAASLRRRGASRGSCAAFAVSTPETGVDSIALTYALLGPGLAVARPLAALLSALLAGVGIRALGEREVREPDSAGCEAAASPSQQRATATPPNGRATANEAADTASAGACGGGACCCASQALADDTPMSWSVKLAGAWRFGFFELFDDLAVWLLAGFVIAGVVAALVPEHAIAEIGGDSVFAPVVMLLAGLPLYVCATSSTPVAAALMLKGLSPGAALVFLLAGPATNAATMAWVLRDLGPRALFVYLASIAVVALGMGYALDAVDLPVRLAEGLHAGGARFDPAAHFLAATLLLLIVRPIATRIARRITSRRAAATDA